VPLAQRDEFRAARLDRDNLRAVMALADQDAGFCSVALRYILVACRHLRISLRWLMQGFYPAKGEANVAKV
jgi:hypothetical protein